MVNKTEVEREDLRLAVALTSAHISNTKVKMTDIPGILAGMLSIVRGNPLSKRGTAIAIKVSIHPDYLICLICGRRCKTLKRHIAKSHSMTIDQYRSTYALPIDYPMTAPNYSKRRKSIARQFGLGKRNRK